MIIYTGRIVLKCAGDVYMYKANYSRGGGPMSRLVLSIAVDNAPTGKALGIKEAIAMDLEKYGDVTVLQVETQEPEQMIMKEVW